MSFIELVFAVALGRALTPVIWLLFWALLVVIGAGLWGVYTGAGAQP